MNDLDELDIKVAEAKGMIVVYPTPEETAILHGCRVSSGVYVSTGRQHEWGPVVDYVPNFASDIATAWELVGDAEQAGVGFDLCNCETTHYETGKEPTKRYSWVAIFYDPWGGPACREYKAEAPTAADAIARAYYDWQEGV
jgi:hypothetical protein